MKAGYTRKELLFVISIVAVLVFIFYPVFQPHPRDKARRASCLSNMKQLGLAFIQYAQDNDNAYPSGRDLSGRGWAGQLYPYVKANGIYKCPEDKLQGDYVSYAENANLVRKPVRLLSNPAATVELYEISTPNCDPSSVNPLETISATGTNAPQHSRRHDYSSWFSSTCSLNFLAADGHVKYLPPGKISNGANALSPKKMSSEPYVLTFAVK